MGTIQHHTRTAVKPEEKNNLENTKVDGKILFKILLKEASWGGGHGLG
jgi:hypothetical protein